LPLAAKREVDSRIVAETGKSQASGFSDPTEILLIR
jgi:hypothetical protein